MLLPEPGHKRVRVYALCVAILLPSFLPHRQGKADTEDDLQVLVGRAMSDSTAGVVAAVTITSLCIPASTGWEIICPLTQSNMAAYSALHGYGLRFFSKAPSRSRPAAWMKVPLLLSVLLAPGVRYAYWCDADSTFLANAPRLAPFLPPEGYYLALHDDAPLSPFMNTGQMAMRASKRSRQLLEATWKVFPPPFPQSWWEQSAVNYVLLGSPERCKESIWSESACHDAWRKWPNETITPPAGVLKQQGNAARTLLMTVMGFQNSTARPLIAKHTVLQHASTIVRACENVCDSCRRGEILAISQWCPGSQWLVDTILPHAIPTDSR